MSTRFGFALADRSPPGLPERQSLAAANQEPLLLSASDVANLLSVSTRTLWRLLSSGRLPQPVAVGGSKRWRREEIVAWVAAGCPPRAEWSWNGKHCRRI
ncbi:MAG: helix-turn-helix domain-containing protein [Planctomycetes bacterium]|nr:helix-turn-helix domain-containing protein [Planctomycetota bacterium]